MLTLLFLKQQGVDAFYLGFCSVGEIIKYIAIFDNN